MESVVGHVVASEDFVEPEGEGICWSARVWVRGHKELHDVGALVVFFRESSKDVDLSIGAVADPLDRECEPVGDWDGTRDASVVGLVSQRWAILFAHAFIGKERAGDIVEAMLEDGISCEESFLVQHCVCRSG
jgi:hypothetical protein